MQNMRAFPYKLQPISELHVHVTQLVPATVNPNTITTNTVSIVVEALGNVFIS